MSAPTLPGVRVSTPYVLRKREVHRHVWRSIERIRDGQLWKIHVCVLHDKPVLEPYEVVALSPAEEELIEVQ